jgi:hypothetical protein
VWREVLGKKGERQRRKKTVERRIQLLLPTGSIVVSYKAKHKKKDKKERREDRERRTTRARDGRPRLDVDDPTNYTVYFTQVKRQHKTDDFQLRLAPTTPWYSSTKWARCIKVYSTPRPGCYRR